MRGTPIKLVFSGEEDFLQDIPRQISIARYKGTVANGKIVAADLKLAATAPLKGLLERTGTPSKDPDSDGVALHVLGHAPRRRRHELQPGCIGSIRHRKVYRYRKSVES
jgi:hypothetical protein